MSGGRARRLAAGLLAFTLAAVAAPGAAGEDIERQVRETYRQLLELAESE